MANFAATLRDRFLPLYLKPHASSSKLAVRSPVAGEESTTVTTVASPGDPFSLATSCLRASAFADGPPPVYMQRCMLMHKADNQTPTHWLHSSLPGNSHLCPPCIRASGVLVHHCAAWAHAHRCGVPSTGILRMRLSPPRSLVRLIKTTSSLGRPRPPLFPHQSRCPLCFCCLSLTDQNFRMTRH